MHTWDAEKRAYIDELGNVVSEGELRRIVDDALALLALLFSARAKAFADAITIENFIAWNSDTRVQIKSLHYAMTTLAYGGVTQMNADRWAEAEAVITNQLGFFDRFTGGVLAGALPLDGTFPVRTALYALAGYATFMNAVTARERLAGMNEYRNVLGASDHCVDCLTEAAKGWVALGSLSPIGTRICLVRCRCHFMYRKV